MRFRCKYIALFCLAFCLLCTSCGKAKEEGKDLSESETLHADNAVTAAVAPDAADTPAESEAVGRGEHESKAYQANYKETGELPSLAEIYKDSFYMGVAVSKIDLDRKEKAELIAYQFNSLTCENEMKADFTLDRAATIDSGNEESPVVNMKHADPILKFAMENGLKMRGHTLVWHSQTPRWLFTVGYDNSPDAPFVTREVMLKRMENYIRQELEYVNKNYPGVVYAWDVVNEAIEPGDGQENSIRIKDNLWFEVIGEDYIEMAFTFARKYASPDQQLFYNDYGTYEKIKLFPIIDMIHGLKEKDLIDGIGLQDHIGIDYPAILDYQYAINKYTELGITIQVTELDIGIRDNTEEAQQKLAARYKNIFAIINNCKKKNNAQINSITFWGLTDDRSWLNNSEGPSYPLLFDRNLEPKPAFFGVLQDESIKAY